MQTWLEFAWASFLYGANDGDRDYQRIMSDSSLLSLMRNDPQTLSLDQIQHSIIKGFLNRWSCRLPNNITVASGLRNALIDLQPWLFSISGLTLREPLSTTVTLNGSHDQTLADIIRQCYSRLHGCARSFAATATTKLLHILNPSLFVMWDAPMIVYYRKVDSRIESNAEGYACFHKRMQGLVKIVDHVFSTATLSPQATDGQKVEDYLSAQLDYTPAKSIAKFADEYNWIVITNGIETPPRWHP